MTRKLMMMVVLALVVATSACRDPADANRLAESQGASNDATVTDPPTAGTDADESAEGSSDGQPASAEVWIYVEGMTKVQGIT